MKTAKIAIGTVGVAALGYSIYTFWKASQPAQKSEASDGEADVPPPRVGVEPANPMPVVQPEPVVDVMPGEQESIVVNADGSNAFDGNGNFVIPPQSGSIII